MPRFRSTCSFTRRRRPAFSACLRSSSVCQGKGQRESIRRNSTGVFQRLSGSIDAITMTVSFHRLDIVGANAAASEDFGDVAPIVSLMRFMPTKIPSGAQFSMVPKSRLPANSFGMTLRTAILASRDENVRGPHIMPPGQKAAGPLIETVSMTAASPLRSTKII